MADDGEGPRHGEWPDDGKTIEERLQELKIMEKLILGEGSGSQKVSSADKPAAHMPIDEQVQLYKNDQSRPSGQMSLNPKYVSKPADPESVDLATKQPDSKEVTDNVIQVNFQSRRKGDT